MSSKQYEDMTKTELSNLSNDVILELANKYKIKLTTEEWREICSGDLEYIDRQSEEFMEDFKLKKSDVQLTAERGEERYRTYLYLHAEIPINLNSSDHKSKIVGDLFNVFESMKYRRQQYEQLKKEFENNAKD